MARTYGLNREKNKAGIRWLGKSDERIIRVGQIKPRTYGELLIRKTAHSLHHLMHLLLHCLSRSLHQAAYQANLHTSARHPTPAFPVSLASMALMSENIRSCD